MQDITHQYNNKGLVTVSEATNLLAAGVLRTTHAYDAQGRDTLELNQVKVGNNWVNESRTRIKYDQQGHMTYFAIFEWNRETNQWEIGAATRHTHTYDSNNRLSQSVSAEYEENNWNDISKSVYEYAGSSLVPVSITSYERMEGAWVADERMTELVYTQNQFEQSYILQLYDGGAWFNNARHTFSYSFNAAANTTTVTEVVDAFQNNTWVPGYRTTVEFMAGDYLVSLKSEVYENNQWIVDAGNSEITQIQKDAAGSITDIVFRFFDEEAGQEVNFLRFAFSDFINVTVTGVKDDVLAGATQLYPNPVTDKLHVALDAAKVQDATVSIHSITGQKMYERSSLRGEATIDLSTFPGGVYLVRVTGPDNAGFTKKIVKQ